MREKHLLGPFKGFFMEIETFLSLHCLECKEGQCRDKKKVEISMKNHEKGPNMCFSQVKKISSKISRILETKVVLCPAGLHSYI